MTATGPTESGWRRGLTADASPNVLLLVLDSVRAVNTSVLGHRHETTPFLDSFAERSTLYTQARTPGTWSLPAHVSLFTGLTPPAHGVTIDRRLEPGHTVFEALGATGYETGVFGSNVYITDHPVGVGAAFDTVQGVPDEFPDEYAIDGEFAMEHPDGFWFAERFLEWTEDSDGPWAACVNVMDGHRPYLPRPEYDRWGQADARAVQAEIGRSDFVWKFYGGQYSYWYLSALETLYDGAIRQADAVARQVVRGLDRRGDLDDTLVVITADHGDGLGERSPVPGGPRCIAHTLGTHETLTHVPLLVKAPGQTEGERVDSLATLARFPDAVAALAAESVDAGAFVPESGRCLTYRRPIDGPKLETARQFCGDDHDRYTSPSVAVYEDRPDEAVEKRALWGDRAARVVVHGAGATVDSGPADPEDVRTAVEAHRGEGISTNRPTDDEDVPESVREHLRNIGYL